MHKLHEFLVVKAHNGNVVMKVRKNCFTGEWKDSPLPVRVSTADGVPTTKYSVSHLHSISAEKMANMVTMYDCFIPSDCRLDYLPPLTVVSSTNSTAHTPAPTPTPSISSISGRQRKRKQNKCSTEGCDGSGHRKKTNKMD